MSPLSATDATPLNLLRETEAQIVLRINQAGQEHRLNLLEKTLGEIATAMGKLASLDGVIVGIKSTVDDHETRIRHVEHKMPVLELIKGWVITGVLGIMGLLGTALVTITLKFMGVVSF